MSERDVMILASRIIERCQMNYGNAAGIVGVAPATLRYALLTMTLPKRVGARRAIERFAELNKNARNRADLRLVDLIA